MRLHTEQVKQQNKYCIDNIFNTWGMYGFKNDVYACVHVHTAKALENT